jgi:hypothetical protein
MDAAAKLRGLYVDVNSDDPARPPATPSDVRPSDAQGIVETAEAAMAKATRARLDRALADAATAPIDSQAATLPEFFAISTTRSSGFRPRTRTGMCLSRSSDRTRNQANNRDQPEPNHVTSPTCTVRASSALQGNIEIGHSGNYDHCRYRSQPATPVLPFPDAAAAELAPRFYLTSISGDGPKELAKDRARAVGLRLTRMGSTCIKVRGDQCVSRGGWPALYSLPSPPSLSGLASVLSKVAVFLPSRPPLRPSPPVPTAGIRSRRFLRIPGRSPAPTTHAESQASRVRRHRTTRAACLE